MSIKWEVFLWSLFLVFLNLNHQKKLKALNFMDGYFWQFLISIIDRFLNRGGGGAWPFYHDISYYFTVMISQYSYFYFK